MATLREIPAIERRTIAKVSWRLLPLRAAGDPAAMMRANAATTPAE